MQKVYSKLKQNEIIIFFITFMRIFILLFKRKNIFKLKFLINFNLVYFVLINKAE